MGDLLEERWIPRRKAHVLWARGVRLVKLMTMEPHEVSRVLYDAERDERERRSEPVRMHRVVFLLRGRREWLPGEFSLARAQREVAALKRRGFTAWVTDVTGRFVPVPGARREPRWLP